MLAIQHIHRTSDANEQHELRQGRREGAHGARGLNSTTDKQGPLIAQSLSFSTCKMGLRPPLPCWKPVK